MQLSWSYYEESNILRRGPFFDVLLRGPGTATRSHSIKAITGFISFLFLMPQDYMFCGLRHSSILIEFTSQYEITTKHRDKYHKADNDKAEPHQSNGNDCK